MIIRYSSVLENQLIIIAELTLLGQIKQNEGRNAGGTNN